MRITRRFTLSLSLAAAMLALVPGGIKDAQAASTDIKNIGIIGAGHVGSTIGTLWVKAGYHVMFATRHPDELKSLVEGLGPLASAGTPAEAASFGQVVMLAVPYSALPALAKDVGPKVNGKLIINASNPVARRDGATAQEALKEGAGKYDAALFPDAQVVRTFNTVGMGKVAAEAHKANPPIAVPLAGDDKASVALASSLVRDAGLEPVYTGPLSSATLFQPGGPGWGVTTTAADLRQKLGLSAAAGK
ncbi:MAG TPA: NAD(P)-binding domain-containing protein [Stellaceae bacterium]|jgi:predicted dinucleotide-binding enzyme|nr:NAD(P)-binding domain-containing protein [Stellaceae bacterium]